jgi:hypothetical protein
MIPKILHFCFGMKPDFGGKPWSLLHHVCVKSAVERIRPSQALFYYQYEPTGPWWRLTRELVTLVNITAPATIFGNPVPHMAHRADIVRMERLLEVGGIYLDCDVFVHRDFDDLLRHSVVLGREGAADVEVGLCNAVILAEPQAPFLKRWYEEFRHFRSRGHDHYYNELSVKAPLRLASEFPAEVTILPHIAFFWPTWQAGDIEKIFASVEPIVTPGTYATHLWEANAWDRFIEDLTPRQVRSTESNFCRWARPLLEGLPDDYGAPALIEGAVRQARRLGRRTRTEARNRARMVKRALVTGLSTLRGGRGSRTLTG